MLGIGIGWMEDEFRALGIPFDERAARTEEACAALRTLWKPGAHAFKGEHYAWDALESNPKPVQPGGVPIVVGGHVLGAARRAARVGDGFFPMKTAGDRLCASCSTRSAASARGSAATRARSRSPRAAPGLDLDAIRRLEDQGVSRLVTMPPGFSARRAARGSRSARQHRARQALERRAAMADSPYTVIDASGVPRWDDSADVVIAGLGVAGACAAIEAREAGADVLVLERASGGGGTTANAAGHVYLGGGTRVQKAVGVEDDVEDMYTYLHDEHARARGGQDPPLLRRERGALRLARGAGRAVQRHDVPRQALHADDRRVPDLVGERGGVAVPREGDARAARPQGGEGGRGRRRADDGAAGRAHARARRAHRGEHRGAAARARGRSDRRRAREELRRAEVDPRAPRRDPRHRPFHGQRGDARSSTRRACSSRGSRASTRPTTTARGTSSARPRAACCCTWTAR